VKFIEIHPMKIKVGMYAPTKEQYKATGTDRTPSPGDQTQNLNEKAGKLIPFSPNRRLGSSTVGNGACQPKMVEPNPLTLEAKYQIQWRRLSVSLSELAKQRWVHKKRINELAVDFDRSPITIKKYLQQIRADKKMGALWKK
jgi:hypothetical protein